MKKYSIAVAMLTALMVSPVVAQTKIGSWEVEKRDQDTHCNSTRAYKGADGDQNILVMTFSDDAVVFVFINSGWEWGADDKILNANFSTDKVTILKKSKWEVMNKTTVRGTFDFDQSILDKLGEGKRIFVDFEDDEDDDSITFETPRIGEALAALKFCEENRVALSRKAPRSRE